MAGLHVSEIFTVFIFDKYEDENLDKSLINELMQLFSSDQPSFTDVGIIADNNLHFLVKTPKHMIKNNNFHDLTNIFWPCTESVRQ